MVTFKSQPICSAVRHGMILTVFVMVLQRQQPRAAASTVVMMTSSSLHYVEVGHTILRLDCQFQMDDFSLFVNPIFWRKRQLDDEAVPINFQGNVLEPFLSTRRFNAELASSSDRRRYNPQLTIYGVTLDDSGNYTCEVHGRRSVILASVTHTVHVAAPLTEIYFATDPLDTFSYLVSTSRGAMAAGAKHRSTTSISSSVIGGDGKISLPSVDLRRLRELNLTASVPTSLRCIAVGNGYPVPDLRITVGSRDVTERYFRRTTTATFRSAADDGVTGDKEAVSTGLRYIEYRTVLDADRLALEAGDDGAVMSCTTASIATQSPAAYDHDHTAAEQEASLQLHVHHVPRIDCSDTSAMLGAQEVFLRCEVVARPQPTALYWQLQPDSPNDTVDGRISHGQGPHGEHLGGDGFFWTVATDRSDGCLETRLYIGKVLAHSFRWYTIVAENDIGTTKARVRLTQEFEKPGTSTSQAAAAAGRRNQHHRGSPSKKHAKHAAGGSTDGGPADDDYYEDGIEDDAGPDTGVSGGDVRKLPKHRGSNGHQRHSSTDRRSQTLFGSVPTNEGYRSASTSISLIAGHRTSSCFVWNALFDRLVRIVSAVVVAAAVVFIRFSSSSMSFSSCVVSASLIVVIVPGVIDCLRVRTVLG